MKTREEILKELRELAPQLSQLQKADAYVVPEGYFTAFTDRLLQQIALADSTQELKNLAPALAQLQKQSREELPAHYFKSFSAGLLNKIRENEVGEELRAIAPTLSSLPKVNTYQVPEGYFGTLAQQVIKEATVGEGRPEGAVPGWVTRLNAALDGLAIALFKPAYSFAMAGGVAVMVIVAMVVITPATVEPACASTDLLCMLEKEDISNSDLEAYFATHPDEFGKSVLDISTDDKRLEKRSEKGDLSLEEYLQSNISDEELNNAILN